MKTWVAVLALLVAGCVLQQHGAGRLQVVATFYPLYEFARAVGAEQVEVRQLVPAGADPHDYEPTPGDVARLQGAAVFVYNGAGLEPWVSKLEGELPARTVRVEATRGLPLVEAGPGGHGDEDHGRDSARERLDPHVWLDPVLAQGVVDNLAEGLARADPAGEAGYRARAQEVKRRLEELHRRYGATLSRCRTRVFVTAHGAFQYLARRYGLRLVSVAGVNPEAEPSPRRLRELVGLARGQGVRAVFAEAPGSHRTVDALARELRVPVLVLDPLEVGPRDGQEGPDYFRRMEANLEQLARGLGCGDAAPAGGGR